MRIKHLRLQLPPRMRPTAQRDARLIAGRIAAQIVGDAPAGSRLSVTVPGLGRPASVLGRDAARRLAKHGKRGR